MASSRWRPCSISLCSSPCPVQLTRSPCREGAELRQPRQRPLPGRIVGHHQVHERLAVHRALDARRPRTVGARQWLAAAHRSSPLRCSPSRTSSSPRPARAVRPGRRCRPGWASTGRRRDCRARSSRRDRGATPGRELAPTGMLDTVSPRATKRARNPPATAVSTTSLTVAPAEAPGPLHVGEPIAQQRQLTPRPDRPVERRAGRHEAAAVGGRAQRRDDVGRAPCNVGRAQQ